MKTKRKDAEQSKKRKKLTLEKKYQLVENAQKQILKKQYYKNISRSKKEKGNKVKSKSETASKTILL